MGRAEKLRAVRETFSGSRAATWRRTGGAFSTSGGVENRLDQLLPGMTVGAHVIADIGCATGEALVRMEEIPTVSVSIALDVSRHMLRELGRRHPAPRAGVQRLRVEGAVEELSMLPRIDLIVARQVLHHLADPAAGFRVLAGLLAERGRIVLMVPGKGYLAEFWPARAQADDRLGRFDHAEIESLAANTDLSLSAFFADEFNMDFDTQETFVDFLRRKSVIARALNHRVTEESEKILEILRPLHRNGPPIRLRAEYLTAVFIREGVV